MRLHEKAGSGDAFIILGCRDDRVVAHGAWLAENYSYKTILITGGTPPHNPSIESWVENSEAEHFLNVFQAKSQVKLHVLVESKAMKPYMERRVVATFEAQWPTRMQYFELRLG